MADALHPGAQAHHRSSGATGAPRRSRWLDRRAGLAAKPIIDIDLSVPDADDENAYLGPLTAAGYHLRVRQPGHRMVRTQDLGVQVRVCTVGSEWERRHLLFRDWLRHNDCDRELYGQLKLCLAQQDWPDMNAYADAKGQLIAEISERAETWARSTGWTPTPE